MRHCLAGAAMGMATVSQMADRPDGVRASGPGRHLLVAALTDFARFAGPIYRAVGWRNVNRAKDRDISVVLQFDPRGGAVLPGRFAANRVSPEHHPGRRKLIVTAGKFAVAAPFVIAGYGATVGRTSFRSRKWTSRYRIFHPIWRVSASSRLSDLHLGPFLSEAQLALRDRCSQRTAVRTSRWSPAT